MREHGQDIDGQDIERIAREIEQYIHAHPHAADSLTGIARWWLPMQRYLDAQTKVKMALDLLIARGRVEKKVNIDGTYIYSIRTNSNTCK